MPQEAEHSVSSPLLQTNGDCVSRGRSVRGGIRAFLLGADPLCILSGVHRSEEGGENTEEEDEEGKEGTGTEGARGDSSTDTVRGPGTEKTDIKTNKTEHKRWRRGTKIGKLEEEKMMIMIVTFFPSFLGKRIDKVSGNKQKHEC